MQGFPGGSVVKNLTAKAGDTGDTGSIPAAGGSSGGGNSDPLQYSCLGDPQTEEPGGVGVGGRFAESEATESVRVCTHTHKYAHILLKSMLSPLTMKPPRI